MSLTFACQTCCRQTEWIHLESLRFFCNEVCYNQEPVIRSTRDIRKTPRIKCPLKSDQKCHIFGLNAAKVILNHYAFQCERIDDETLEKLIVAINSRDNIECCTAEKNLRDKETEKAFLEVFLYKTRPYDTLNEEGRKMYDALKRVFEKIQTLLEDRPSEVIQKILDEFGKRYKFIPITIEEGVVYSDVVNVPVLCGGK